LTNNIVHCTKKFTKTVVYDVENYGVFGGWGIAVYL